MMADLASDNPQSCRRAYEALVTMGELAVPFLVEALSSHNERMRREAAKALAQIGSPELVPIWINLLEDEDCDVRWFATEGLIRAGDKAIVPLLRGLEQYSDSVLFRMGAHRVLYHLARGNMAAILGPVVQALEDIEPSLEVIVAAFQALDLLQAKTDIVR